MKRFSVIILCVLFPVVDASSAAPASQPASRPAWASKAPKGATITEDGWFAPKPKVQKPPLPKKITKAFVIPIREPIKDKTFRAMKRKVIRCRARGAQLIILDMDTYGGEVKAALDITGLLKQDLDDIYVLCYVRTNAISAGAMIALACDEIIMNPVGKLGDCAPIALGTKLEGVEREKIESPLRTEFEESAERSGYNTALATSMVSFDQEVWEVRNIETHELRYVLAEEYRNRVLDAPEKTSGKSEKKSKAPKKPTPRPVKQPQWELMRVVLAEGKLLTMTPKKGVEYGFVTDIIKAPRDNPYAGLREHFNIASGPVVLKDTWSEDMVDFLTHPVVAGILMALMLLFGYTEMHTPGFGVFGAIAIFCLVLLLTSQFLVGLAQWWELGILLLGVLLIMLEIFVIPGFGVAGISGILLCVVGLLAMVVPNAPGKLPIPSNPLDWELFSSGLLSLSLGFIASLIAAAILSRYLPKIPLFTKSKLILAPVAASDDAPRSEDSPMLKIQVGQTGQTESMLRPVGRVRFGDDLLNAVSEGGVIESGRTVRVLHRDGNRIVVEEV